MNSARCDVDTVLALLRRAFESAGRLALSIHDRIPHHHTKMHEKFLCPGHLGAKHKHNKHQWNGGLAAIHRIIIQVVRDSMAKHAQIIQEMHAARAGAQVDSWFMSQWASLSSKQAFGMRYGRPGSFGKQYWWAKRDGRAHYNPDYTRGGRQWRSGRRSQYDYRSHSSKEEWLSSMQRFFEKDGVSSGFFSRIKSYFVERHRENFERFYRQMNKQTTLGGQFNFYSQRQGRPHWSPCWFSRGFSSMSHSHRHSVRMGMRPMGPCAPQFWMPNTTASSRQSTLSLLSRASLSSYAKEDDERNRSPFDSFLSSRRMRMHSPPPLTPSQVMQAIWTKSAHARVSGLTTPITTLTSPRRIGEPRNEVDSDEMQPFDVEEYVRNDKWSKLWINGGTHGTPNEQHVEVPERPKGRAPAVEADAAMAGAIVPIDDIYELSEFESYEEGLDSSESFETASQADSDSVYDFVEEPEPSYVDFDLGMRLSLSSTATAELTEEALADMERDVEQYVQDLRGMLTDIRRVADLGELPVTMAQDGSVVRIHFPNADSARVQQLLADLDVSQGVIGDGSEMSSLSPISSQSEMSTPPTSESGASSGSSQMGSPVEFDSPREPWYDSEDIPTPGLTDSCGSTVSSSMGESLFP